MDLKQQRQFRLSLTEAIINLCRTEAVYEDELRIEGTVCIVSDRTSVVIAHITECLCDGSLLDSHRVENAANNQAYVQQLEECSTLCKLPGMGESQMVVREVKPEIMDQINNHNSSVTKPNEEILQTGGNISTVQDRMSFLPEVSSGTPKAWTSAMMDIFDDPAADVKRSANGRFRCPHCDKSYGFKHTLRDHINTHLGRRPHVCQHCGVSFTHLASLCAHVKRRHNDSIPSEFQCQLCGEKAMNYQSMKQHYTWRHRDVPFPHEPSSLSLDGSRDLGMMSVKSLGSKFPPGMRVLRRCRSKGLSCMTENSQHVKMSETDLSQTTENNDCAEQLHMGSTSDMDHLALLESFERQDYQRMMNNADLMTTASVADGAEPQAADDDVSVVAALSDSFETEASDGTSGMNVMQFFEKVHIQMADGWFTHKCRFCGNLFKNRSSLHEHLNSHFGMRPHACIHCGDRFAHHSSLHNHMRNKHSFASSAERLASLRHHCAGCNRRFRFPSELERHLRCNPEHASGVNGRAPGDWPLSDTKPDHSGNVQQQ